MQSCPACCDRYSSRRRARLQHSVDPHRDRCSRFVPGRAALAAAVIPTRASYSRAKTGTIVRTMTSRSHRGQRPSARCSKPSAQARPQLVVTTKELHRAVVGRKREPAMTPGLCAAPLAARHRHRRYRPRSSPGDSPDADSRAAVRKAVCAPIDCPMSTTGRSNAAASITAATSSAKASRDRSSGIRVLRPWPRWSMATVRQRGKRCRIVPSHSPACPASPCSKTTGRPLPPESR